MSSDDLQGYAAPQDDGGSPDAVETDAAGLSAAEDLDEDRLRQDPLEAGMDPPEHWSGVDKYGMTPYEESHPRPLDERLSEEQPDVTAEEPDRDQVIPEEGVVSLDSGGDIESETRAEAASRGQSADEGGGSVAGAARTPDNEF
ncbi:hypothetical protein [Saccharothrix hoggarensis]|uniref:DUF5709 domain-containing protein n=1 Tax=Saccharothrix hoggarensis TaxID=913853 RepID=A0ABW3QTY4_9PSEU